jgi:hypothetical protein
LETRLPAIGTNGHRTLDRHRAGLLVNAESQSNALNIGIDASGV